MSEELLVEEGPQIDFYIQMPSEADMPTVLADFYKQDTETTVNPDTGEETTTNVGDPYLVQHTHHYAIDVVGTIYKPTGNMLTDADGNEYPEMAAQPGWHVNIRLIGDEVRPQVEALSAYEVNPVTPERVWL